MVESYQVLTPLSNEEYSALKKSIEEDGVLVPIEFDEEGNVLDGHHRLEICEELGIEDYPNVTRTGFGGEEEKRTYIRKINLARRHLNQDQKAELVKGQLKDTPGKSNNQIAKMLGVSDHTVKKYRKELEESSQIANFSKLEDPRTGELSQPAEKKTKAIPAHSEKDREKAEEIVEKAEEGNKTAQEQVEKLDKGRTTVTSAQRQVKREENRENQELPELPEDKFNVILADPPWNYNFSRSESREIENQYPTMTLGKIKEIDVPSADDSVLFLWVTAPKLEEGIEVLDSWGFDYKTCAVWDKEKMGMGYWFRCQHELLLVGKRGKFPPPNPSDRISSVIREERKEHSEKPEIHKLLRKWWPDSNHLELFAREERENWTTWGDEVENSGEVSGEEAGPE